MNELSSGRISAFQRISSNSLNYHLTKLNLHVESIK